MKRSNIFTAEDGTTFETAADCKRHEERSFMHLLVQRSAKDVDAALDRSDLVLADAFERAGNIIASKRRASGERKRARKSADKAQDPNVAMDTIKRNMKAIS